MTDEPRMWSKGELEALIRKVLDKVAEEEAEVADEAHQAGLDAIYDNYGSGP